MSHRGQTGLSKPAVRALSSLRRADWPLFRSQPYSKSRPLTTAQVTAFYLLLGGVALGVPLMLAALRAAARPCWSRRSARVRARVRSSARCSAALLLGGAGVLSAHLAALAPPDSTVRPVVPAAAGPVTHGSRRPPALPCALRTAALWPAEWSYGRLGPVVPPYSLLCKAPPRSPSSQRFGRLQVAALTLTLNLNPNPNPTPTQVWHGRRKGVVEFVDRTHFSAVNQNKEHLHTCLRNPRAYATKTGEMTNPNPKP